MEAGDQGSVAWQAFRDRVARGNVPGSVKLDLTYACNLRCVHCCIVPEAREELTFEEICTLFVQLAAKGCLYLALSGGEIFLRDDLREILEEAHRRGFCLRLMTNATRIPEDLIPEFRRLNVGEVAVSLYGDEAVVHDSVTLVPGSFEQTVKSVRHLRSVGIRVKISLMLLRQNVSRFREMVSLAEELEAPWTLDPAILPAQDGSKHPLEFRIPVDALEPVIGFLEEKVGDLKRMKEHWDRDRWLAGAPCGAGATSCSITPYGDVLPCPVFPYSAGNIRERSFADIWDQSPQLAELRVLRRRDLKECSTCDLAPFCILCPARSLIEDGDLLGPCRYRCSQAALHRRVYERMYLRNGACRMPEGP